MAAVPLEPIAFNKYVIVIWDSETGKTKYKINYSMEIRKIYFVNNYLAVLCENVIKIYDGVSFELVYAQQTDSEIIDSVVHSSANVPAKSFVMLRHPENSCLIRTSDCHLP